MFLQPGHHRGLLFLLVAIPVAYLLSRDRPKIPPGHCQKCGYDLTGNTSGVCPECGEPTCPIPNRKLLVISFSVLLFCFGVYSLAVIDFWFDYIIPGGWRMVLVSDLCFVLERSTIYLEGQKRDGMWPPPSSGHKHHNYGLVTVYSSSKVESNDYRWRSMSDKTISVNLLLPVIASLIYPIRASLLLRRRRARRRMNHCADCGCKLIGNTSSICPECGEQI